MSKRKAPLTASAAKLEKYQLWPSLRLYDRLAVPYVLGNMDWNGPLWTGHCMMLDTSDRYKDSGFFHELAHWMAATPAQRKLPDFGIDRQVNAEFSTFATSSSSFVYMGDRDEVRRGWGGPCRTPEVSGGQETIAVQALGVYEPLVGLWPWSASPTYKKLNKALFDFTGYGDALFSAPAVKRLYAKVVRPLAPSVPLATVERYLAHVSSTAHLGT